jgi:uracil-DNA glycosylase family 4
MNLPTTTNGLASGLARLPNSPRYQVAPEGPRDAKIAVVCEKPAQDEIRYARLHGQPRLLVGETGQAVRRHLKRAGLNAGSAAPGDLSREVWLTNAVQSFDSVGNPTNHEVALDQPRLFKELASLPNLSVVIAMGAKALLSLTNYQFDDIGHRRGSVLRTAWGTKLVPTYHPSFYFRGNQQLAPVVQFDVDRAVEESKTKCLTRTIRTYHVRPTLQEALAWMDKIRKDSSSPYLSFDIETLRGRNKSWYISCIAFSVDPTEAFCIPILHRDRRPYWTDLSTESLIWRGIADLLCLPDRVYITQNGAAFDCPVLHRHGVRTPFMLKGFDTYSAHSLRAPDLPHSLEFLVSIYTDEPYYKDESGRGEEFGSVSEEQFWTYNCKDAALTLAVALPLMTDMKEL